MPKNILIPQYIHGDFCSVEGDAVKLLKHHLFCNLFPVRLFFSYIDWTIYHYNSVYQFVFHKLYNNGKICHCIIKLRDKH
jgi:hypothetical protein